MPTKNHLKVSFSIENLYALGHWVGSFIEKSTPRKDNRKIVKHWQFVSSTKNQLFEKHGIEVCRERKESDLIVCCEQTAGEALRSTEKTKVIILNRALNLKDNVYRLLKSSDRVFVFAPGKLNKEMYDFRNHTPTSYLTGYKKKVRREKASLTHEEYDRILPMTGAFWCEFHGRHKGLERSNVFDKTINVFFSGSIGNAKSDPFRHFNRSRMIETYRDCIKKFDDCILFEGKSPKEVDTFPKYCHYIRKSKVVLCPWGHNEITGRESMAAMAGAVPIKQNTDYLTLWPNVHKYCCWVNADWSNLEQAISLALEKFEKEKFGIAEHAIELLSLRTSPHAISQRWAYLLNRVAHYK